MTWHEALQAVATFAIPPLASLFAAWLAALLKRDLNEKTKADIEHAAKVAVTAIAARLRHVENGVAKEEAAITEAAKLSPRKFASLPMDEQKTIIQSAYFREVKRPSLPPTDGGAPLYSLPPPPLEALQTNRPPKKGAS